MASGASGARGAKRSVPARRAAPPPPIEKGAKGAKGAKSAKGAGAKRRSGGAGKSNGADRAPGRGKYDRTRTPDERQKEQLRRLLDASAHVFAEVGWAEATVEAIVSRAGMSRRTFYEHFDDLKECLLTLHQRASRRAFRAVEMAAESQAAPGDMLRLGVEGLMHGIAAFPHVARVMFRVVRAAGPEFEQIHDQMMARFAKLVFDGVQKAYDLGRAKVPPDELRVFALVSAMEAVAMRYVLRGEEQKAAEAAPILIDMVQRTFA
jgi:AcrR family transcriptional regulator